MTPGALLRARATFTPKAVALFAGERSMTYAELDRSTDALARWFVASGLTPGDRVAIQWPNAIEVVQVFFAAFKAGLTVVPINLRLKPNEIAWVLENCGASLCFAPQALAGPVEAAGVPLFTELPELGTVPSVMGGPVHEGMPALIMYTSGSTGRPKGAVLSQGALVRTGELCTQDFERTFGDLAKPRGLLMTPLMHSSGLYVLLGAVRLGEPCVLLPAFDPAAALDALERYECTLTLALPAMMQFLLDEQERRPRNLSSLRVIFAGGDSVAVALQERVKAVIGCRVVEALAQTETGPTIGNPLEAPKPGSLGVPYHGVEVRLVDTFGKDVAVDEPGELLVKSDAVCTGYWNNPSASAEAFVDGWFRTGDQVSRDGEGYYWFRGRLKEIIVRGGSNISPQEVEEVLYTHPAVHEAAVVGMPHQVWGEVVVAAVALREGSAASEDDLREHVRQTLSDYKVPERIYFMPLLPKGPTGKVQRRAIKESLSSSSHP